MEITAAMSGPTSTNGETFPQPHGASNAGVTLAQQNMNQAVASVAEKALRHWQDQATALAADRQRQTRALSKKLDEVRESFADAMETAEREAAQRMASAESELHATRMTASKAAWEATLLFQQAVSDGHATSTSADSSCGTRQCVSGGNETVLELRAELARVKAAAAARESELEHQHRERSKKYVQRLTESAQQMKE